MAEIPVTKKSGVPWWVWAILGAIVLLLLVLFLGNGGNDAETGEGREVAATETSGDTITDLSTIEAGTAALAGRQVDVDGVTVEQTYGGSNFSVVDQAGGTAFVVFDPTSSDMASVGTGQTVDVAGEVFEVRNGQVNGETVQGLPAGMPLVIYASEVAIGE